jgi:hypothetical protein
MMRMLVLTTLKRDDPGSRVRDLGLSQRSFTEKHIELQSSATIDEEVATSRLKFNAPRLGRRQAVGLNACR